MDENAAPEATESPFDSEASFLAAIDTVIMQADREIHIFDDNLERMTLNEKTRAELLTGFLADSPRNRLLIVVHNPRYAETRLARLHEMVRRFPNTVEIRESAHAHKHIADSFVLADQCHGAIRFHRDHARGKLLCNSPDAVRPNWQRFDELWRDAIPCLAPTQIGL